MAKFFIPDWVLESRELAAGAKLVLAVLATRSTQSGTSRVSLGLSTGSISDLVGMHYVSVDRTLKSLVKDGYLERIKGGFRLVDQEGGVDATADDSLGTKAHEPSVRDLFHGCTTLAACKDALKHGFTLGEYQHSYRMLNNGAPFGMELYQLLVKLEDAAKAENLPADHVFKI